MGYSIRRRSGPAAQSRRCAPRAPLLVADEVQYGLGRSGSHFWGFERRGLNPDIVTMGKPVGNGFPMGVIVARRDLVEAFQAKFGLFLDLRRQRRGGCRGPRGCSRFSAASDFRRMQNAADAIFGKASIC